MTDWVIDFIRDEKGASALEYVLLACGIAVTIMMAVVGLGTALRASYQSAVNVTTGS